MRDGRSEEDSMGTRARSMLDRRDPLNWLILGGLLLIAAILAGTAIIVLHFRERALGSSERELENTVLLLAHHFDLELRDLETIQRDTVLRMQASGIASPGDFRREMSGEKLHRNLQGIIGALSDAAGVNVFDAAGKLINSSRFWPVPATDIADSSYFKQMANDGSPLVVLAPVDSHLAGGWTTIMARKVVGPNGEFLGVVTRGISPANLERHFQSVRLGKGAAISLLHRDGTMLARYPHVDGMIGRNFRTAPAQQLLSKADHGTIRLISPVDGEERLAAVRALADFPLSIMATTTVATELADWRAQTRLLVIAAALAALVIAFILFLIVRKLSRRHEDAERRLALEKERLDTAVNNMTQGLLLYDADARIVLCNRRYLEMYGLSSDVVKPGCHFRDLIAHRKETGSFSGDVDCAMLPKNS
jgi:PAS domain-containing protein